MIPKRTTSAMSLDATIPVGNGQLPPINELTAIPGIGDVNGNSAMPMGENNAANAILRGIMAFAKASKANVVPPDTLNTLISRKMIVQAGDYYIVSEKGLTYLVDFGVLP